MQSVPTTPDDDARLPVIECPDCAALSDRGGVLDHRNGCPKARAIDAMQEHDRQWFARHPYADEYRRGLLPGDLGLDALSTVRNADEVRVQVRLLGPGIFDKRIDDLDICPDTLDGQHLLRLVGTGEGALHVLDIARSRVSGGAA